MQGMSTYQSITVCQLPNAAQRVQKELLPSIFLMRPMFWCVMEEYLKKKKAIGYFDCHSHHCSPHAAKALCCVNGTIVNCTVHFLRTICKGNFRQKENIEKQLNKQETPQARCHVNVIHRYFLIRSPH